MRADSVGVARFGSGVNSSCLPKKNWSKWLLFTEEKAAEFILGQFWGKRQVLIGYVRELYALAKKGKVLIVVFGAGGTGKSTLGKLLSGQNTPTTLPLGYTVSLGLEPFGFAGHTFGRFLVPPGQEVKRPYFWNELYEKFSTVKRFGIMNLVSWGYHALDQLKLEDHKLYKEEDNTATFLDKFLTDRRQEEIKALNEIAPHIKSARGKFWMITLVTKQDLWWEKRTDLKSHYEEGEYDKIIKNIENAKGKINFIHHYLSASLNFVNLSLKDGTVLAPTTAGYDREIMNGNLNALIKQISQLASLEEPQEVQ